MATSDNASPPEYEWEVRTIRCRPRSDWPGMVERAALAVLAKRHPEEYATLKAEILAAAQNPD